MLCTVCKLDKLETEFYKRNNSKKTVTSSCRECHKIRMRKRQHEMKLRLVVACGGCCNRCGYSKNPRILQFHHVDDNKEFGIAKRLSAGFEFLLVEAKKCELLCANCHMEEHLHPDNGAVV